MRSKFDTQLANLNKELIEMGALCEQVIALAAKSLAEGDIKTAKKIFPLDDEIDQKERDIESMCLKMLLQQQPVARDLRQISAALKMITDMERIGDHAVDISEIALFLDEGPDKPDLADIPKMADEAVKMLTGAINAYVYNDEALAKSVIESDDVVDELFLRVKTELTDMIVKDSTKANSALDLLMIAKYMERIADHATNIAEWVVFSITGVHKDAQLI